PHGSHSMPWCLASLAPWRFNCFLYYKGTSKNRDPVIPAKAGIQYFQYAIDSRFRGNDDY
ncbi:MAG: hypothetical protein M1547_07195, partial [Gammaproteobacteria bacterium]|nr:hypothetical protein [Gammaproteobacteria bacterium]